MNRGQPHAQMRPPPEWKSPPGLPGFTGSIQTRYGYGTMNRLYHLKK
jgi:hypothetical protein